MISLSWTESEFSGLLRHPRPKSTTCMPVQIVHLILSVPQAPGRDNRSKPGARRSFDTRDLVGQESRNLKGSSKALQLHPVACSKVHAQMSAEPEGLSRLQGCTCKGLPVQAFCHMRFSGLRSRWTIPSECNASSARATCLREGMVVSIGKAPTEDSCLLLQSWQRGHLIEGRHSKAGRERSWRASRWCTLECTAPDSVCHHRFAHGTADH